jgi:aldose sugar dehydrogenase
MLQTKKNKACWEWLYKKQDSEEREGRVFVFLYYIEAWKEDRRESVGNRLYKYELIDQELANPKLLLKLPSDPGPYHNGGK